MDYISTCPRMVVARNIPYSSQKNILNLAENWLTGKFTLNERHSGGSSLHTTFSLSAYPQSALAIQLQ